MTEQDGRDWPQAEEFLRWLLDKAIGGVPELLPGGVRLSSARELADEYLRADSYTDKDERVNALIRWEMAKNFEPLAKSVVRPSFCLRRRGEGWSAGGMQRSQDGSGRHRRGSGVGRIHEVLLPVMRASTRDEMWRISFTSRSSSRLFSIHSL